MPHRLSRNNIWCQFWLTHGRVMWHCELPEWIRDRRCTSRNTDFDFFFSDHFWFIVIWLTRSVRLFRGPVLEGKAPRIRGFFKVCSIRFRKFWLISLTIVTYRCCCHMLASGQLDCGNNSSCSQMVYYPRERAADCEFIGYHQHTSVILPEVRS